MGMTNVPADESETALKHPNTEWPMEYSLSDNHPLTQSVLLDAIYNITSP